MTRVVSCVVPWYRMNNSDSTVPKHRSRRTKLPQTSVGASNCAPRPVPATKHVFTRHTGLFSSRLRWLPSLPSRAVESHATVLNIAVERGHWDPQGFLTYGAPQPREYPKSTIASLEPLIPPWYCGRCRLRVARDQRIGWSSHR